MKAEQAIGLLLALGLLFFLPLETLAQSPQDEASPQVEEQEASQSNGTEIAPLPSLLTAMNIPARAILCGLDGGLASVVVVFSAGMKYAEAAKMIEDGCSGPWIITSEMLEGSHEKEKMEKEDEISVGDMLLRQK